MPEIKGEREEAGGSIYHSSNKLCHCALFHPKESNKIGVGTTGVSLTRTDG